MGFVVGNNNDIQFVLTNKGKKALLENGLDQVIKYFSVHDDEVIYTVDVYPKVVSVNGTNKNATMVDKTGLKQSLK